MRNVKSCIFIFTIVALMILLCSCSSDAPAPWETPGSRWSDQANGISFSIPDNADEKTIGTYTSENETLELIVKYDKNQISFFKSDYSEEENSDAVLYGNCKFDEKVMTVVVEGSKITSVDEGDTIFFFKSES